MARHPAARPLLVLAVTFLVGYTIAARWLFPSEEDPVDDRFIEVPDLVGVEVAEADRRLRELGFSVVREPGLHHPDVAAGGVVAQAPLGGQVGRPGDTVRVTPSAGSETRVVPELRGLAGDEAAALLRGLGFEVTIELASASTPGVLETRPAPGTRLAMPAEVEVIVSEGAAIVPVPDLRGRHADDVEGLLEAARLRLGAVRYQIDAPEGPGRVVSQSPVPGSSLRADGLVSIVVAGPPPDDANADLTERGAPPPDSVPEPGGPS